MASHNHGLRANNLPADRANPGSRFLGQAAMYAQAGVTTPMASQALADTGGSQPHSNLQPFLVMNFIIALVGLYPSR
jgi:microcystin-dependent protein